LQKALTRVYPPRHLSFYLQRTVLRPAYRQKIASILSRTLPRNPDLSTTPEQQRIQAELRRDGFSMLPALVTPSQLREITEYLQDKQCYNRWAPKAGTFPIKAAPPECHVAVYQDRDIIECPHLLEIANHPDILAAVEGLFGCRPTISSLSCWWSLTGHSKPEEAELFHRDVDEWQFIKLFIYLSDVDEGSGPHKYVRGTANEAKLLRIRRYTDEEIAAAFGAERLMTFTGPACTSFLENTFGFHKGELPKTRNRLLFQAQYSMFPIGIYDYEPIVPANGASHRKFDPRINRLYLRQKTA